jgi:hypothetical protein
MGPVPVHDERLLCVVSSLSLEMQIVEIIRSFRPPFLFNFTKITISAPASIRCLSDEPDDIREHGK